MHAMQTSTNARTTTLTNIVFAYTGPGSTVYTVQIYMYKA